MEIKIRMMTAASKAIAFKKQNPMAIDEEAFQHISDYIQQSRISDETIKRAMIAAAGKAFKIAHDNPDLSEKELLKQFVEQIPLILESMEENY